MTDQIYGEAAIEQPIDDEAFATLLHGAEEIATINESLRAELRDVDVVLRHMQAKLDQQIAYAAKLQELLDLRGQLDTALHGDMVQPDTETTVSAPPNGAEFTDLDGRECGEHRTTGTRAWCFDCSEKCSPDIPCKGCERPHLLDELERAQTELAMWENRFGESALRDRIAQTEQDVSAFEASQELLRSATDTISDLRARLSVLPEWQCPRCGATTRARLADVQEQLDVQ
jgi:hypothetical protein